MVFPRLNGLRLPTTIGPATWIMGGRTLGFIAAFAIPLVLARCFDPEQFGTYRQLFLIYSTCYGIAQVGMAESLYFFLPRHPESAGRWIANALAVLGAAGLACLVAAQVAAPWLAREFHNAALTQGLPTIALMLALTLVATPPEIVMISRRQHRLAAVTFAGSDIARAVLLTVPAAVTHRLDALLMGAVVFGLLRCGLVAVYLRHELRGLFHFDAALLLAQLRYALPFGVAVAIGVVQLNLHQYAVASWFDPATFAIYSVGCLQVPFVDILMTSVANVMMVTMGEHMRREQAPVALWQDTVRRLAFVFVPLATLLMLCAHDVIVTLFTQTYAGAAPVFTAFTLTIVLAALPVDAVLRAYAETRFLLWMNVLQLVFVASTIAWFVATWHLLGAVLVTVVSMTMAKALAVHRIARLMRVDLRDVLPWRQLAGTVAAAALAAVPVVFIKARFITPPLLTLLISGAVYGLAYLVLAAGSGVLQGVHPAVEPEVPAA